jgi:hypothetical protein
LLILQKPPGCTAKSETKAKLLAGRERIRR